MLLDQLFHFCLRALNEEVENQYKCLKQLRLLTEDCSAFTAKSLYIVARLDLMLGNFNLLLVGLSLVDLHSKLNVA